MAVLGGRGVTHLDIQGAGAPSNHVLDELDVLWCAVRPSALAAVQGSYLRLIDSYITQLKPQGPSRICNEGKEEEKKSAGGWSAMHRGTSRTRKRPPPQDPPRTLGIGPR